MLSYFNYSIACENFVFYLIFQPMQDDSATWPGLTVLSYVLIIESMFLCFEGDLQIFVQLLILGVVLLDFFSLIYFYLLLNLGKSYLACI